MTDTIQRLLRQRAEDPCLALLFEEEQWSWREYVEESSRRAAALISLHDPKRPFHVGLLLDNTPEMAMGLADREHLPLLDGLDLAGARVVDVDGSEWRDLVTAADPLVAPVEKSSLRPCSC